jgi:hypothetical protein
MSYKIINKFGKTLDKSLYTICTETKIFNTSEDELTLNFQGESDWDFHSGDNCEFITGDRCTIKAYDGCYFKTGDNCFFSVDNDCVFKTGDNCKFETLDDCVFKTGDNCKFIIYPSSIIYPRDNCILNVIGKTYKYVLKGNICSILLEDGTLLELKNKNDALLNLKSDEEFVRAGCEDILKNGLMYDRV